MTNVRAAHRDAPSEGGGLEAALDGLAQGFLLFDSDDRLVTCNAAAQRLLAPVADALAPGATLATLLRALAECGAVDLGGGDVETWVKARLAAIGDGDEPLEAKLADDHWLDISAGRTGGGGRAVMVNDITAYRHREQKILEGDTHYRKLNEIGVALSAEKDVDRLMELILLQAKQIANADGGTVYLYVNEEVDEEWQKTGRIDRRCGGDRRSGRDRRSHLDPGADAATGDDPERDKRIVRFQRCDRRSGLDRRRHTDALKFAIMRNDTLDIAMGGTTGKEIEIPPLRLFDPDTGEGNYKNVAAVAALTGRTVNIPDAYTSDEFDFSGTKAFDAKTGYRSTSFLTIPMMNKKDEVIGVLQLINARDETTDEVVPFEPENQGVIESLASQAAVALDNQLLLDGQRRLLDAFIQLIASAIDEKSPYTGGHCARVPELTKMIAAAACDARGGPFKDFDLNDEEKYELHIAGWMHDCGKVTTREYVVDKATKLETIFDRIDLVRTRFEVIKRDAELAYLRDLQQEGVDREAREAEYRAEIEAIESDRAFLEDANVGGEFMSDEKKERVMRIAARRWRGPDGEEHPFLSEDEIENLCIGRGTLTAEERQHINDHIVVTIEMLEKLPFPKGLKRVPEYAGGHHEKMDGTGYPRGLRREQMSVPARMMAIADIFEALTAADRPYKKAKTLSEAMAIMSRMRENDHIDPELFELFVEAGVYRDYAERFLAPEQIDEVDHDAVLGRESA